MIEIMILLGAFILFLAIGSLLMCGWYVITRPGRIFGVWSEFWEQKTSGGAYKLPSFLVHPLSSCVYCFASIYGSLIFWFVGDAVLSFEGHGLSFTSKTILIWICYCIASSAVNGIFIKKVL